MTTQPLQERRGLLLRSSFPALPARLPRLERQAVERPPEPKLVYSYVLTMVSVCLVTLLLDLTVVSQLQHYTAQDRLYDTFRRTLAEGSVPIGQTDITGGLVEPGTPVAELKIPALGVDEIVVEGTASSQTMTGVGHRRDTPLPGQPGVAVLMGRAASYGGVFRDLDQLTAGTELSVQTGQGVATYKVLGVRSGTTELPVLSADQGRLTLVTASGPTFRPTGVTAVDAELVTEVFPRPPVAIASNTIPDSEQVLAGDRSRAFALSWLLLLLGLLVVGAIWSWQRWQKRATWLVFVPVLATVGLAVASSITPMLPNLL